MPEDDVQWMREALAEARLAGERGEVPVGAVLVREGREIARAHNRTISDCDPTAHAEMIALRLGAQALANYRLAGTTLYVTIEPCAMCAGAMIQARISRLVYGCPEPKGGAVRSCFAVFDHPMVNHRVEVSEGVLRDECLRTIQAFFEARR
jgi:tRNA(Arg) A34 adenosine deaminase TadA